MLANVRAKRPLVHCITNYVTVNDCANAVLASGASPIMADDSAEVDEITTLCAALCVNIGTLCERSIRSMIVSAETARRLAHPSVLDPVGAGASKLRTDTARRLFEHGFTVVRGNLSELRALADIPAETRGVDAGADGSITDETRDAAADFVAKLASRGGCVAAATSVIDVVSDGSRTAFIRNGDAMMGSMTGAGCCLSALCAAFTGANPDDPFGATTAAICAMGLCGELARARMTERCGNASFRTYLIDALYNLTPSQLEEGAKYELR